MLTTLNLYVFQLSGVAILGVGIWFLVDPNLQDYIDVIHTSDEEYFRNAAYLLIAFGAFIFLVGFSGCCGAIRNSKCLLGFVSGHGRHQTANSSFSVSSFAACFGAFSSSFFQSFSLS